jgi:hypothetical protein
MTNISPEENDFSLMIIIGLFGLVIYALFLFIIGQAYLPPDVKETNFEIYCLHKGGFYYNGDCKKL